MKLISSVAKAKLEADLEELEKEKDAVEIQLEEAIGFGDFSENEEYKAAKTSMASLSQRIQAITQTLRTAKVTFTYPSTIGPGSLISVQQITESKELIEDLGLLMFDEVGDIVFSGVVNAQSTLGAKIRGNGSGVFSIQDPNGKELWYRVVLEPETRLAEFIAAYGDSKTDRLSEIYSQVQR